MSLTFELGTYIALCLGLTRGTSFTVPVHVTLSHVFMYCFQYTLSENVCCKRWKSWYESACYSPTTNPGGLKLPLTVTNFQDPGLLEPLKFYCMYNVYTCITVLFTCPEKVDIMQIWSVVIEIMREHAGPHQNISGCYNYCGSHDSPPWS